MDHRRLVGIDLGISSAHKRSAGPAKERRARPRPSSPSSMPVPERSELNRVGSVWAPELASRGYVAAVLGCRWSPEEGDD